jgi:hypothetical protein
LWHAAVHRHATIVHWLEAIVHCHKQILIVWEHFFIGLQQSCSMQQFIGMQQLCGIQQSFIGINKFQLSWSIFIGLQQHCSMQQFIGMQQLCGIQQSSIGVQQYIIIGLRNFFIGLHQPWGIQQWLIGIQKSFISMQK